MRSVLNAWSPVWMLALFVMQSPCSAQPDSDGAKRQGHGETAVPGPAAEFLPFLERVLPRKGSFIAIYEPVNPKAYGRATAGFDAATGAWFVAGWTDAGGGGRDPEGQGFAVGPRKGSARAYEWTAGSPPLGLGSYFPSSALYYLFERPTAIQSVERTQEGHWIVSWQRPDSNDHQFPLAFIEVAADGTPLKRWQDQPDDRREEVFRYAPESPTGFPLLAGTMPGQAGDRLRGSTLTHVEYFADGNLAPFSQESVADTCYDNSVIVEMKQQAIAAGILPGASSEEAAVVPAALPFAGRQWAKFRWPLIIAGGILVALAGIEAVRRRKG
jgi:hypothetical protein